MAKIKLTKSAVDAAQPQAEAVELRDTLVPGFLCKITPAGRKVFMLQYRTNAGERRKPSLGLYGELTVEQARSLAQEWLAQVRRGGDPAAEKAEARQAPTVKELCTKFMEDYSKKRNKLSTQAGYQAVINRNIIPLLGRKKVQDVKRPEIAGLMEKLSYKQTEANKVFSVLRKMFNMAEVWGYRPDGIRPDDLHVWQRFDGVIQCLYPVGDSLERHGVDIAALALQKRKERICPVVVKFGDDVP